MIIRVIASNILSFGQPTEFNMFPSKKHSKLNHHKYRIKDFEVLKVAVIYGANGAGKSNLIKVVDYLIDIINDEKIPLSFSINKHKFSKSDEQILGMEFFSQGNSYYYEIGVKGTKIFSEELLSSGLGKKEDQLVYSRKLDVDDKIILDFHEDFESNDENKTLKNVLEKNLVKHDKPILQFLAKLDNSHLSDVQIAFSWFEQNNGIQVIEPGTKPVGIPFRLDQMESFKQYANDIMCSFDIGISGLKTETKTLEEFFGEDNEKDLDKVREKLHSNPKEIVMIKGDNSEVVVAANINGEFLIKRLVTEHETINQTADFYVDEESDGTNRLLDYVPLFYDIVNTSKVYFVDEIERSLHPLIVKELLEKFSNDKNTKGQLIFTTHESHLLDQNILRQDEIWFAEKNKLGATDLYPLTDFKEHHTKNFRKGYLNGRYGAIPFLGNLKDLNWKHDGLIEQG